VGTGMHSLLVLLLDETLKLESGERRVIGGEKEAPAAYVKLKLGWVNRAVVQVPRDLD
jgi:hypothetical protein